MVEMLSDNVAIILGIAALLLALTTPFFSPLFRWKRKEEEAHDVDSQPVSIIIASHDDAPQLEKHLPSILQQDYPVGYEVIVVIQKGDHDVEDALKRIKYTYEQQGGDAHFYVTYIPQTSRYMSRRKLAITLGVKAAKNEWLLLLDSDCAPSSPQWLAAMARPCADDKSLVVGYSSYDADTSSFKRYERFYHFCYLLRECGTQAYRTNCPIVMFRKSQFMSQNGYLGNLELVRGEYDFLVNKYAEPDATAISVSPTAWVVQNSPTRKSWLNAHVYYMETRKLLQRGFLHRLVFGADQVAMRLFTCLSLAALAYSVLTLNWLLLGVALLSVVLELLLRYWVDKRAIHRFGESFPWAFVYDRVIMWSDLYFMMRHKFADRRDFTTHKQ